VATTTDERIAAVREHFSNEVGLGVVTPATLDRLLDAARKTATPPPADTPARTENTAVNLHQSFERVLNLFDEEAGRFQVLRQKLQQLASHMSEREQRLHQLEEELGRVTGERQRDQMTIERLRNDLHDRDGRLERAAAKAQELAAIIRGSGPR
jgi:septal ring factor EnvC (AmiA/AmiB activator)